jgi:hypothetical protein
MSVKILGLDWFDVLVQAAITMVLGIAVDSMFRGGMADVGIGAVIAGSLAVLGWRRKRALTAGPLEGSDRLEELEARVAELDQVAQRVYELEERLDFTERMLAQTREKEQARLPGG